MYRLQKEDFLNINENIKIEKKVSFKERIQGEHIHEFVEIIYILGGEAIQQIDDKSFNVKRGDMLFVDYNQVHSYQTVSEIFSYVDILLEPQFVSDELLNKENIFEIFNMAMFSEFVPTERASVQLVHFSGNDMVVIEELIENMLQEFEGKKVGYLSVLSGYARVLFSLLLRKLVGEGKKKGEVGTKITPDVIEYINKHCNEKLSLEELAQRCFYNPTYFSHAFKKYCGKNLSQYIKERRISNAIELLEATDMSIGKIGVNVGYDDKAFFYKVFKEITGKTPASYREEIQKKST